MGIFLFDVPVLYEIYPSPIWQAVTHCIENVIGLDPANTFIDTMKKNGRKNDSKRENQETVYIKNQHYLDFESCLTPFIFTILIFRKTEMKVILIN